MFLPSRQNNLFEFSQFIGLSFLSVECIQDVSRGIRCESVAVFLWEC